MRKKQDWINVIITRETHTELCNIREKMQEKNPKVSFSLNDAIQHLLLQHIKNK